MTNQFLTMIATCNCGWTKTVRVRYYTEEEAPFEQGAQRLTRVHLIENPKCTSRLTIETKEDETVS